MFTFLEKRVRFSKMEKQDHDDGGTRKRKPLRTSSPIGNPKVSKRMKGMDEGTPRTSYSKSVNKSCRPGNFRGFKIKSCAEPASDHEIEDPTEEESSDDSHSVDPQESEEELEKSSSEAAASNFSNARTLRFIGKPSEGRHDGDKLIIKKNMTVTFQVLESPSNDNVRVYAAFRDPKRRKETLEVPSKGGKGKGKMVFQVQSRKDSKVKYLRDFTVEGHGEQHCAIVQLKNQANISMKFTTYGTSFCKKGRYKELDKQWIIVAEIESLRERLVLPIKVIAEHRWKEGANLKKQQLFPIGLDGIITCEGSSTIPDAVGMLKRRSKRLSTTMFTKKAFESSAETVSLSEIETTNIDAGGPSPSKDREEGELGLPSLESGPSTSSSTAQDMDRRNQVFLSPDVINNSTQSMDSSEGNSANDEIMAEDDGDKNKAAGSRESSVIIEDRESDDAVDQVQLQVEANVDSDTEPPQALQITQTDGIEETVPPEHPDVDDEAPETSLSTEEIGRDSLDNHQTVSPKLEAPEMPESEDYYSPERPSDADMEWRCVPARDGNPKAVFLPGGYKSQETCILRLADVIWQFTSRLEPEKGPAYELSRLAQRCHALVERIEGRDNED